MEKLSEEEKKKGAQDRWDSIASEPIKNLPVPKELLEKWKKEGKI